MSDNQIRIDHRLAEKHGIKLDKHGWPTTESLNEYHEKENGIMQKEEEYVSLDVHMPLWLVPVGVVVVALLIALR